MQICALCWSGSRRYFVLYAKLCAVEPGEAEGEDRVKRGCARAWRINRRRWVGVGANGRRLKITERVIPIDVHYFYVSYSAVFLEIDLFLLSLLPFGKAGSSRRAIDVEASLSVGF